MTKKIMDAFVLTGHGGPEMLEWRQDYPMPEVGDSDVMIQVEACGLNNTDINTRTGWYSKKVEEATSDQYQKVGEEDATWGGTPMSLPRIQGADVCGVVVEAGKNANKELVGKRVITDNWMRDWDNLNDLTKTGYFGSERDGGYAQYTVIDYRNVGVIDSERSSAELASFSCSYTTAEGMLERANVNQGDVVLVTGASGGVGSALIQLAKRRGAKVVAMANPDKHDEIKQTLNPDVLIPSRPDNPKNVQKKVGEISVVCDVVGGKLFGELIGWLKRGGRYTCSGAIAGPIVELDLRTLYLNDLTFHGSTVTPPSIFQNLIKYIEANEIKPIIAKTFPLQNLKDAQKMFTDKNHVGNIVVTVSH